MLKHRVSVPFASTENLQKLTARMLSISVSGTVINGQAGVLGWNSTQICQPCRFMKGTGMKVKGKAWVAASGMMERCTRAPGRVIVCKARVSRCQPKRAACTAARGRTAGWQATESKRGLIRGGMMGSGRKTRETVLEKWPGQTATSTLVSGRMIRWRVMAPSPMRTGGRNRARGSSVTSKTFDNN